MTGVTGGFIRDHTHWLPIRVYYEDTDFSGVVYYANYLKFCERGRTEFLRALDIHHADLFSGAPDARLAFMVRRIEGDFLAPARIDDLVQVETRAVAVRGASVQMRQRICRGDEDLFRLAVQLVVVGGDMRPTRIPAEMRDTLLPYIA